MDAEPDLGIRHSERQESFEGPAEGFVSFLEGLRARDARSLAWRRRLSLLGVLALLAVPLTAAVELWTAALVSLIVGVVAIAACFIILDNQCEERKLELVRTLLETFAGELRPGRPVAVSMDFRAYGHFDAGEPWLTLQMVLGNGVSVRIGGYHRHKIKTKEKPPKTTPRWKPGYTKKTVTITERLVLCLVVPADRSLSSEFVLPEHRPEIGRFGLRHARTSGRRATFVFESRPLIIVHRRRRTSDDGYRQNVPRGEDAVRALIVAHHLLERAAPRAAEVA